MSVGKKEMRETRQPPGCPFSFLFFFFFFLPLLYFSPLSISSFSFSFSYVSEGVSVAASPSSLWTEGFPFLSFFFFLSTWKSPFPAFCVHAVPRKEGVYADETSSRPRVNHALTIVTCASKLSTC